METVILILIVSAAALVAAGRAWGFVRRSRQKPCDGEPHACQCGGGCGCTVDPARKTKDAS